MKLNCNNENTSNEFCIHIPVITCWSNQLDKIKNICLKYIPDCKELEDELSEIQKQCLTEIKGILLVNYKNMKLPIENSNKLERLTNENEILVNQLRQLSQDLIEKTELIQIRSQELENIQKEIKKMDLELTVTRIQQNIDKDKYEERIYKFESQIEALSKKLEMAKSILSKL
ncbi:hypothetical protein ACR3K2_22850 [Cryptosporidium serpentis]